MRCIVWVLKFSCQLPIGVTIFFPSSLKVLAQVEVAEGDKINQKLTSRAQTGMSQIANEAMLIITKLNNELSMIEVCDCVANLFAWIWKDFPFFACRKTMKRLVTNAWNGKWYWHRPKVQSPTMSNWVSHCWIKSSTCICCCANEIIKNRNSRENRSKNKSILSPKRWTPFRKSFNCPTIWLRKKPDRT